LSTSIEDPHEPQRPLAGIGEFFAPQDGQLIDEEVFAAAAIGDRLGKRPLWGKGVTEIRARGLCLGATWRHLPRASRPKNRAAVETNGRLPCPSL
jgi:hypothetical protein